MPQEAISIEAIFFSMTREESENFIEQEKLKPQKEGTKFRVVPLDGFEDKKFFVERATPITIP